MQLQFFLFTDALQTRATQEGWQLTLWSTGFRITRPSDSILPDDAAAVALARAAGVPCEDDGTFPTNTLIVPAHTSAEDQHDLSPAFAPLRPSPDPVDPPFERTTCACDADLLNCYKQPGPLIPRDIARIAAHLQMSPAELGQQYLWASPGAILVDTIARKEFRVPTITPRRSAGGCVFLRDQRCTIHPVAPFGCSHFDVHMTHAEGQRRSVWAHAAIDRDADYARFRDTLPEATSWEPKWQA